MITLRLYKEGDYLKIKEPVEPFASLGNLDEAAKRGIAAAAMEDGNIMAVGGIALANDNEGLVWLKMDKNCSKKPILWARTVRDVFNIMVDCIGSVKVSAYILDRFCRGEKLAGLVNLVSTGETEEFKGNIYNVYTMNQVS